MTSLPETPRPISPEQAQAVLAGVDRRIAPLLAPLRSEELRRAMDSAARQARHAAAAWRAVGPLPNFGVHVRPEHGMCLRSRCGQHSSGSRLPTPHC